MERHLLSHGVDPKGGLEAQQRRGSSATFRPKRAHEIRSSQPGAGGGRDPRSLEHRRR